MWDTQRERATKRQRELEGEKGGWHGDKNRRLGCPKQYEKIHTEQQNKKTRKWCKREENIIQKKRDNSRRPLKGLFTCTMMIITNAPPVRSPPTSPLIALCDDKWENDLNALAECVFPMEDLQAVSGQEPFVWSWWWALRGLFKSLALVLPGTH